uniref:Uncharacterized protein LOC104212889 n=1 Tax=Nicotiana sylvestris TaxID=4096 RepID=A0A1U7VE22_NICSY
SEPPALQSVPIVREFPEVFPDDLPGLPPERIIDFANDGIRLDKTEEGDITAYALAQSSLVAHVKAKQDEDPYLVKLKEGVRSKEITPFTLGSDGVLKLNDRLCVPDLDGLRKAIMEEAHSSRPTDKVRAFPTSKDDRLRRAVCAVVHKRNSPIACYQASIGMAPYEALYERRCRSPVGWFEPAE